MEGKATERADCFGEGCVEGRARKRPKASLVFHYDAIIRHQPKIGRWGGKKNKYRKAFLFLCHRVYNLDICLWLWRFLERIQYIFWIVVWIFPFFSQFNFSFSRFLTSTIYSFWSTASHISLYVCTRTLFYVVFTEYTYGRSSLCRLFNAICHRRHAFLHWFQGHLGSLTVFTMWWLSSGNIVITNHDDALMHCCSFTVHQTFPIASFKACRVHGF